LQRHLDGYRVIGVTGTEEALALAEQTRAIAVVAGPGRSVPFQRADVLVVTCPLPSAHQAALALGARDLLVKPVSRQDLFTAIDRMGRSMSRVLVADDDPEAVRLFERMLSQRFPAENCLEAFSGPEALAIAKMQKPDLILLDLLMPEMDGRSVLEQMAADPDLSGIPVILVSAWGEDYASVPLSGHIQIAKSGGFELGEIVRLLDCAFNALVPGWYPLQPMVPGHAEGPPA
jgi:CheY-like chemotaxis protein